MKQCLITGGGSKFGAELTRCLTDAGYHVYVMTSNREFDHKDTTVIPVDWHALDITALRSVLPTLPSLDLIFFNHNASALSAEKFRKHTIQKPSDWQQSYFVCCQLPFYIIQGLAGKLSQASKVGWMLTDLIKNPSDRHIGYADYVGNKFTNACIMRSFAHNFPATFFGIYPDGGFDHGDVLDERVKAGMVTMLIDRMDGTANGKIYSHRGTEMHLFTD